ncbi:hypothetical protein GCM10027614_27490 [Micromonospora vulcania]
MGAKTALLAFVEGDIRSALRGATRSERVEAEVLVRQIHPGCAVTPADDGTLLDDTYPPDDITYATRVGGVELYCDRRFMLDRPPSCRRTCVRPGRAGGSSCTGCTRSWTGWASRSGWTVCWRDH